MTFPSERTAQMMCPGCSSPVDARFQTGSVSAGAAEGDVSVCFYCSALGIYVGTPPMALRAATPEEERALRREPQIKRMLADLMLFRAKEGLQ